MTFLLFVVPAIAVRSGGRHTPPLEFAAVLADGIAHSPGTTRVPARRAENDGGGLVVHSTGDQSSNRLATFDGANCLIRVPEDRGDIAAGESVPIVLLAIGAVCSSSSTTIAQCFPHVPLDAGDVADAVDRSSFEG